MLLNNIRILQSINKLKTIKFSSINIKSSRNLCQNCTRLTTTLRPYNNFNFCINQLNKNNNNVGRNLLFKRFIETKTIEKEIKVKLKRKDIKRLLSLATKEKWTIFAAIGCLVISSGITMLMPFALGKILDTIYSSTEQIKEAKKNLKNFCLVLCGIFIFGGIANFGRVYLFNTASLRIVKDLRSSLYNHMLHQEVGWFDTKGTGELINRLSSDTFMVGNSLSQNLSDGLRSTVTIIASTGMMFYTSSELALVGLGVVPCVAGIAIIYGRYVRNITKELLDCFALIMKNAEERLGNMKTVKIFCKEKREEMKFTNLLTDALSIGYRDAKARAIFYGLTGLSGNIITVSVLYYGGTLVADSHLTIGALTSFILYAGYTAISLGGLSSFYTHLNKGVGSASRVWEILDRKTEIPITEGLIPTQSTKGEIIFRNIHFNYPSRSEAQILKELNLTIKPETMTAIVGSSGSGKTTIATLLLRLYDPQHGEIYLDGINLKKLNPSWLRCHIGAVNQEPILFSNSIRENILYGLNEGDTITDEKFKLICKQAHIDEFASKLPDGYDTIVGQRGMMLSGGQKQRVAIARALIKNPRILILDEATSALDAVSEELVQNALEYLTKNRTVLTIAHRLSTIRNADSIVVLDQGSIAEQGSYEELMRKDGGLFKNLVKLQTFESC